LPVVRNLAAGVGDNATRGAGLAVHILHWHACYTTME
jgi:hypothetical protein